MDVADAVKPVRRAMSAFYRAEHLGDLDGMAAALKQVSVAVDDFLGFLGCPELVDPADVARWTAEVDKAVRDSGRASPVP